MRATITAAAVLTMICATGCRIVTYTTNIRQVSDSTISTESLQEQAAPKTLGDIAPKTSVTPGL